MGPRTKKVYGVLEKCRAEGGYIVGGLDIGLTWERLKGRTGKVGEAECIEVNSDTVVSDHWGMVGDKR